jgi:type II secretory pathway pseudopilin PulG
MMEQNRRPRIRFQLRTLLFVVAILALLLVVIIQQVQLSRQQVQLSRQQAQIRQMRQEIDRSVMSQQKLTEILRNQRDMLERAGTSSDGRHTHGP